MSTNAVVDLKPFKTMWNINVKVIRLWKQYSTAGGETIEMVLCDLKGGKIQASVKKELVAQYEPFLRQDYSLMLINFAVTHSCGSYRTMSHGYRISFLNTTRFRPCEKLPEDLSGFSLVHDERLPMVLWGKFICDVSEAMKVRDDHSTIFVLLFGYMNGVSDKDDFFIHTPRTTIAQILETKQVEKCILLCTITAINSDMGWFYLSCKVCSKNILSVPTSTNDDGNDDDDLKYMNYCVKCKTYNHVTLPRYKLHLIVLDNTSNTKLLVFDNHAMQLLSQPCLQITGSSNKFEIEETNVLPPALNIIIGKMFLFKIQIERENFVYKHKTYKVLKVITNKDLISDFKDSNSQNGSRKCLLMTFEKHS
ncbi:hypothetical protein N665_4110s0001 [Sinapis alba]|nr:hypothetical protein N665_4110s0001 [Sinapis alba]